MSTSTGMSIKSVRGPGPAFSSPGPDNGRPPSAGSTISAVTVGARPSSSLPSAGAGAGSLSFQGFCGALVHVAAKTARQSAEAMEACPFLSEQLRAYVDSIVPKAQRVLPALSQAALKKQGGAGAAGGGAQQKGLGSPTAAPTDAKEVAAKQAAAKLAKLRKPKAREAGPPAGMEAMEAIPEASTEARLRQGPSSASD